MRDDMPKPKLRDIQLAIGSLSKDDWLKQEANKIFYKRLKPWLVGSATLGGGIALAIEHWVL